MRQTITLNLNLNPKKYLTELLWVLKARSTDKKREQLKYLNVDNTGYACTDGRRLHFNNDRAGLPQGIENGLYDVIVAKNLIIFQPQEGEFPNYQQSIPKDSEKPFKLNIQDESVSLSCAITNISIHVFGGKNSINYDFLKDLTNEDWDIHGEPDKAIKFVARNRIAIVMPLKLA